MNRKRRLLLSVLVGMWIGILILMLLFFFPGQKGNSLFVQMIVKDDGDGAGEPGESVGGGIQPETEPKQAGEEPGREELAAGEEAEEEIRQGETEGGGQTVGAAEREEEEQSISGLIVEEEDEPVTLVFVGDVLFAHQSFEANYRSGGILGVVSEAVLSEMRDADILMVNNEFQFSSRGEPMEDKQYTFECDPSYVSGLTDLGVDIVTLANNHSIDFGREALQDTFSTLDGAGILYAGAGNDLARAKELQIIEKDGMRFGFLAASRVIPVTGWDVRNSQPGLFTAYDDTLLVQQIKEAEGCCDFLTVYLHWGVERQPETTPEQDKIAADCAAAGADLVIGAHPHILQGIRYVDGVPVFYSLGNFIFGSGIEQTMLLKVEVGRAGDAVYQVLPAYASGGRTLLGEGQRAQNTLQYLRNLSVDAVIDENGFVTGK